MVAPFDAATQRLTGPALPARHEVAVGYGSCHAEYALSASGLLALVPREVMPARREVVRLDRAGQVETILPAEKTYGGPALSPDGRQLALTRNEGGPGLLLYDLRHEATATLAATPRREFGAVWDHSGARVLFVVDTPRFQIFEVAASGSGEPKILLEAPQDQIPQDVSPDGQWLLYLQEMDTLGTLPLARPGDRRLFRRSEGQQNFGRFSPDGRFVVFQSDESGRDEVYVRPVSDDARSLPVSRAGGQQPRWATNGEVFFWRGDQLFVVPVRTVPALQVGEARALFRTMRSESQAFFEGDYDVSADGQSIYLARTPDLLRPREIRVVLDWVSEVRRLFALGGVR
jgi:serine/threonine-protein kinase